MLCNVYNTNLTFSIHVFFCFCIFVYQSHHHYDCLLYCGNAKIKSTKLKPFHLSISVLRAPNAFMIHVKTVNLKVVFKIFLKYILNRVVQKEERAVGKPRCRGRESETALRVMLHVSHIHFKSKAPLFPCRLQGQCQGTGKSLIDEH